MANEKKNNVWSEGKKPRADIKFCDMHPLNLHKENIFSSFLSVSHNSTWTCHKENMSVARQGNRQRQRWLCVSLTITERPRETFVRASRRLRLVRLSMLWPQDMHDSRSSDTKPASQLVCIRVCVCVWNMSSSCVSRSGLSCYLSTCVSARSFTYK